MDTNPLDDLDAVTVSHMYKEREIRFTPTLIDAESWSCAYQIVEFAVMHIAARQSEFLGLHDVQVRDLRRTGCPCWGIDGANLPVIQQVLNHSSLTSTQVYARLSIAPVREALDRQAERILASIEPPPPLALEGKTQEWPG